VRVSAVVERFSTELSTETEGKLKQACRAEQKKEVPLRAPGERFHLECHGHLSFSGDFCFGSRPEVELEET
jgi:hypothetical protein